MSQIKKQEGKDKKEIRVAALAALMALQGKTLAQMSKTEQEAYLTSIGQLLNIIDISGKVKL